MVAYGFGVFLIFGACLVLVGANQPELARDLGLDLAGSGFLFSGFALGIGVGVAAGGPLADRLPRRPLFAGSAGLAATALLAVSPDMGLARAALHLALLGLGIGLQETLVNASVADRYAARAARPLIFVHSAATLGAVLGPPAMSWLASRAHWTESFRALGVGELVLLAATLWLPPSRSAARQTALAAPLRAACTLRLVPFVVVGFAYVGVEATLTTFAVPYARGALGIAEARGVGAISSLWLGLFAGRLMLLARREVDARFLLAAGLLGAGVLAAGVGSARIELVYALTGIALGFVFPLMIALTAERFPDARGTATGLVAGAGALGGFAVPWLHGAIGDRLGVSAALAGLVPWCLAVAGAAWVAHRGGSR